jgi:hypothetical protein
MLGKAAIAVEHVLDLHVSGPFPREPKSATCLVSTTVLFEPLAANAFLGHTRENSVFKGPRYNDRGHGLNRFFPHPAPRICCATRADANSTAVFPSRRRLRRLQLLRIECFSFLPYAQRDCRNFTSQGDGGDFGLHSAGDPSLEVGLEGAATTRSHSNALE